MSSESKQIDESNDLKLVGLQSEANDDVPQEVEVLQEIENKVAGIPKRDLDSDNVNQLLGTLIVGLGQLRNDMYKNYSNMRYGGLPFNNKLELTAAVKKCITDSTNVQVELQNFKNTRINRTEYPSDVPAANDDKKDSIN